MEQEQRIFRQTEEDEVLLRLRRNPVAYRRYLNLEEHWRERLEDCISCLLKEKVKIKDILPQEDVLIDGDALMVMDILVELTNHSLVLVEIQKVPYLFPAERAHCYSADLLLRQYSRVKGERGKHFSYCDMKKVYTIIFYENSTEEFHKLPETWVHHSRMQCDSGLHLNHLQEFYFIALDVFKKSGYAKGRNKDDRLVGWLSLLCTEDAGEAEDLCRTYPWLEEIYREMAAYSLKPEEVLGMFSDALREMDRNTVKYMMEQQAHEIERLKRMLNKNNMLHEEP